MVDDEILVVTHPLAPASESHVEALLNILSAITSVALVTTNLSSDSNVREEYEVLEISKSGVGDSIPVAAIRFVFNQIRMCRVIARRNEEVILFFGATSYLLPIVFSRLIGRTVVLEPRGDVPLTLRLQWQQTIPAPLARLLASSVWLLEQMGYYSSDAIITYTPSMAEELGLDKYEKKLHPHGARYIDVEKFSPKKPFEEREAVVGFIGRLDEEKGIRTLAEVVKQLPDDITFRFIGDGPLRGWLETELSEEISEGRVDIVGWVDHENIPDELSSLRLLVLFSQPTEGLPTVVLESMACGTPVYATPVSGVTDVIQNEKTGFLFTNKNSENATNDIAELVSGEQLQQVSNEARATILEQYSFNASVQRYRNIIENIT